MGFAFLAMGAMSFMASQKQAQAQLDQAFMNAMLKELRAESIREAAEAQAVKIRSAGKRLQKTQIAQQASSGIVVGVGSAEIAQNEITQLAEQDALIVIYNGIKGNVAQGVEARFGIRAGINRAQSTLQAGYASLIQAGANTYNTTSLNKPKVDIS